MKRTVVIVAALPDELKYLLARRKWQRLPAPEGVSMWRHERSGGQWIAVCAGMGSERATRAFDAAQQHGSIDALCSIGWAGAMDARLRPGAVASGSLVIDERTGERFVPDLWVDSLPVLVSTESVANATEKKRLLETYGAWLVDMEAATIARLARANGVAFHSIKAISDEAEAKLPELGRFIDPMGQMKMLPFLAHVALRPWTWASLMRLGKNSSRAAENLATAVYDWLDDREHVTPRMGKRPVG